MSLFEWITILINMFLKNVHMVKPIIMFFGEREPLNYRGSRTQHKRSHYPYHLWIGNCTDCVLTFILELSFDSSFHLDFAINQNIKQLRLNTVSIQNDKELLRKFRRRICRLSNYVALKFMDCYNYLGFVIRGLP